MSNQNSPEYLEKIKCKLFENLRLIPAAPSVQMQRQYNMFMNTLKGYDSCIISSYS